MEQLFGLTLVKLKTNYVIKKSVVLIWSTLDHRAPFQRNYGSKFAIPNRHFLPLLLVAKQIEFRISKDH